MTLEIVTQCHRFKLSKHMDQIFLRIIMLQKLNRKMPGKTALEITFPSGLCLMRNVCWIQKSLWAHPGAPDWSELFSHKPEQCGHHPAVTQIPLTVRISKGAFVELSPFLSQLNNFTDNTFNSQSELSTFVFSWLHTYDYQRGDKATC